MHFRKEDRKLLGLEVASLNALVPSKMGRKALGQVEAAPSLVGTGLLNDEGEEFTFNPGTKQACLETPDPSRP